MSELEPIRRQVRQQLRRVRRRRNAYELGRCAALLLALAAGAAATIVALALLVGPWPFAAGTTAAVASALAGAGAVVAGTARRWLGRTRAARWVDRHAGLEGRLATLAEIDARADRPAEAFFLPLLMVENERRLASWRPDAVVPNPPWAAIAAAAGATAALGTVLALAPRLAPKLPIPSDGEIAPVALARVVVPRDVRAQAVRVRGDARLPPAPPRSLVAELQDRLRRRLGGGAPEAARASTAEEMPVDAAPPAGQTMPVDPDDARWEIARARDPRRDDPSRDADADRTGTGHGGDAPRATDGRRVPPADDAAAGEPNRGAGTGSDPRLLGAATDPRAAGERFDVPIVARVRSVGTGPAPPTGEAPPAAPDARPGLGAGQRRDAPVPRADVPPAYEELVRRVFAHAGASP